MTKTINTFARHIPVIRVNKSIQHPITGESLVARRVAIKYLFRTRNS